MTEQVLTFDELRVGTEAPVRTHVLTRTDLVRYAGASGDYNPMHHDEIKSQAAGQPSVFGHGMFSMGMLASAIDDFVGVGNLRSYKVRFARQTWPDEELRTKITVAALREEDGTIELDVRLLNQDGEEKVIGEATAFLPSRDVGA
jgi:acyl dehydratase